MISLCTVLETYADQMLLLHLLYCLCETKCAKIEDAHWPPQLVQHICTYSYTTVLQVQNVGNFHRGGGK